MKKQPYRNIFSLVLLIIALFIFFACSGDNKSKNIGADNGYESYTKDVEEILKSSNSDFKNAALEEFTEEDNFDKSYLFVGKSDDLLIGFKGDIVTLELSVRGKKPDKLLKDYKDEFYLYDIIKYFAKEDSKNIVKKMNASLTSLEKEYMSRKNKTNIKINEDIALSLNEIDKNENDKKNDTLYLHGTNFTGLYTGKDNNTLQINLSFKMHK